MIRHPQIESRSSATQRDWRSTSLLCYSGDVRLARRTGCRQEHTDVVSCKTPGTRMKVATIQPQSLQLSPNVNCPAAGRLQRPSLKTAKHEARRLIAGETLDMAHPFSVFSRLEVEKIKVKHERGSVTLEVSEAICQEDGRILPARTTERELSIVRRSDGVWIISDPQERTYLTEEHGFRNI